MHGHVVDCMTQAISMTGVRDRIVVCGCSGLSVLHSHRGCVLGKHMAYPQPISGWSCLCSYYIQTMAGHWSCDAFIMTTLHVHCRGHCLCNEFFTLDLVYSAALNFSSSAHLMSPKSNVLYMHSTTSTSLAQGEPVRQSSVSSKSPMLSWTCILYNLHAFAYLATALRACSPINAGPATLASIHPAPTL